MLAVPFAREEVFQAICLEPDGAVDEAVLVGADVIPERLKAPEQDVRRVLERATAIGVWGATAASPAASGRGGIPSSCGSGQPVAGEFIVGDFRLVTISPKYPQSGFTQLIFVQVQSTSNMSRPATIVSTDPTTEILAINLARLPSEIEAC